MTTTPHRTPADELSGLIVAGPTSPGLSATFTNVATLG